MVDGAKDNLYDLIDCGESDGIFWAKFGNITNRLLTLTLRMPAADLRRQGWKKADLKDAPSFVIRRQQERTLVEFLSIRMSAVGCLIFPRATGSK